MNSKIQAKQMLNEIFQQSFVVDVYITPGATLLSKDMVFAVHMTSADEIQTIWRRISTLYPECRVYTSTHSRDSLYKNMDLIWSKGRWLI